MALPPEKLERKYTYADYLQWPASKRWELIDGEAVWARLTSLLKFYHPRQPGRTGRIRGCSMNELVSVNTGLLMVLIILLWFMNLTAMANTAS